MRVTAGRGKAAEPYVNHLAEVAAILAEVTGGGDAALVAAGWLHDTIEDTETEREDLEQAFGADVASLVSEVTDDKSLPKAERKRLQVENAPRKSARARLLKTADKISNLRSLTASPPDSWERARLLDYVDWAEQVVAGCRGANPQLDKLFEATIAEARRVL